MRSFQRCILASLFVACSMIFAASDARAQANPQSQNPTRATGRTHGQNGGQPANAETPEENHMMGWEIANFVIFLGLLSWGIAKSAPKFFNARSADIQRAIQEATGLKLDADFRYSEADRKLAALAEEIRRIREQAQLEFEREHEQVRAETRQELDRLSRNVEAEIEAFRAAGAARARQRAADTALALAEQQLRERAAGQNQRFVNEFVHLVDGSAQ